MISLFHVLEERNFNLEGGINLSAIIAAVISAVIVIADQVIKYFVYENLQGVDSVPFIGNLLTLTYVENRGAAFGMLQNMSWLFAIITIVMIVLFFYIIINKKINSKFFITCTALIIGGGVGNLIDRIFRGFVIDYLQLSFFPYVCNLADYCITIGAVMLIIYVLFYYGKNDKKKIEKVKKNDG